MKIVPATWSQHKDICQLARLSPYSKGFTEVRFLKEYYEKKDIIVAVNEYSCLVGFICVRHCVRKPWTSVYYMSAVIRRQGIGRKLLDTVMKLSPWKRLRLISEKANIGGLKFYKAMGFDCVGEGANKQGEPYWILEKSCE